MFRSKLTRMATIGAAATMLIASASPVMASQKKDDVGTLDENKTVETYGGKMTFIDDGDVFKICDTDANGHGVYGALFYNSYINPNGWARVMTTEDGGDAGCDKKGYNIGNSGDYIMVICAAEYPTSILPNSACDPSGSYNE